MFIYFILAILLTFFALLDSASYSKYFRPVYIFYSFVFLFFLAGFRGTNFADYNNYVRTYFQVYDLLDLLEIGRYPQDTHGEPLYLLLNSTLKLFTENATLMFVIVAFLAVAINLICFEKFSPYPLVSVLLYYSHLYLNKELIQIRAGLASALVLVSVIYLKRRQLGQYLGIVLCAAMFHSGAAIVFPMYWICNLRFSRWMLALPIAVGLILGVSGFLDTFLNLLDGIGLLPSIVKHYRAWEGANSSALGIMNPITIKQIFVSLIAIYYKDYLSERLKYFYPLLVMYALSTAWILAFQEFAILAARIATFLSVGDPIIMPSLVILFKEKKIVLFFIVLFAWLMLFLNLGVKTFIPPYQTIFNAV